MRRRKKTRGLSLGVRVLVGSLLAAFAVAWFVHFDKWQDVKNVLAAVGIGVADEPDMRAPIDLPGFTWRPGTGEEEPPAVDPAPEPSASPRPTAAPSDLPGDSEDGVTYIDAEVVLNLLGELEVRPSDPVSGYDRDLFPHWRDTDGNGCDARNDVLARDMTEVVLDTDDCTVLSGTLDEPYTATVIDFVRGPGTSNAVHIDHVVSLGNAWQSGANQWDADMRLEFANDPRNLIAVDGPANSAKGALDAARWVPDNEDYHCEFAAIQVGVKHEYNLSVREQEKAALESLLATC